MSASASFKENFAAGKTQLLTRWVPGDLETPVSVYLKLCNNEPYTLLLESVEGGARLGRYSIIGFDVDHLWKYEDGKVSTKSPDEQSWSEQSAPALQSLRDEIKSCEITQHIPEGLPPMAVSGLFGYMGYDCIRLYENIPDNNPDTIGIPESVMMRPRTLAIFDNVKNMICLATTILETEGDADSVHDAAEKRLSDALDKINKPLKNNKNYSTNIKEPVNAEANMTRDEYHGIVEKAVEYINAGDIFQVVPSQRFTMDFDLPSIALYRSLRSLNPSPFLFHVVFDGFSLVGSSPEILVRSRDKRLTIRPIAGTRKRGKDEAEDKALAEDLLSDPKELAEHLMLLDLGRNDVGRVAKIGSVEVTEQFIIENYSHVMHIVSNVEGVLAEDKDMLDALFSGFPAGTVSGAPKIRAMEIIDELEPVKRSFYGGTVGYFSGNGDMDNCIALRTALVKDGQVIAQAGGGVVADSTPEFEYQETVNKAQAIINAVNLALEQARNSRN